MFRLNFIKDFRKAHPKPLFKVAYVEESIYVGESQLDVLATLKSKNELIADVIATTPVARKERYRFTTIWRSKTIGCY